VLHESVVVPAVAVGGVMEGATEMTGTLVGITELLVAGAEEPIEFVAVTSHVIVSPISVGLNVV
jgi:hypothetical protein